MTEEESVDKKGSEIEYGGIKIRGGKILLIIPLLGEDLKVMLDGRPWKKRLKVM